MSKSGTSAFSYKLMQPHCTESKWSQWTSWPGWRRGTRSASRSTTSPSTLRGSCSSRASRPRWRVRGPILAEAAPWASQAWPHHHRRWQPTGSSSNDMGTEKKPLVTFIRGILLRTMGFKEFLVVLVLRSSSCTVDQLLPQLQKINILTAALLTFK